MLMAGDRWEFDDVQSHQHVIYDAMTPFELETRDLRLHTLVAEDAELRLLAGGFEFTEGPVWIARESTLR